MTVAEMTAGGFETGESFARGLDAAGPWPAIRDRFHLPLADDARSLVYLCSHSLGLQPRAARDAVVRELDRWARLGVEGHFQGEPSWYTYQQSMRGPLARLVGGRPDEVVLMNGLTVNLHLLLATFYRPTRDRPKILIEEPSFPSDLYAVQSQLRHHGLEPRDALLAWRPRDGEATLRVEDCEALLDAHGREVAVVLLNAVNFLTGQRLDVGRLTAAAHRHGCTVGIDLAHAVGNVPLALHDWGVDFAVWCTYKYLCGGPGAVAGCFVHEKHGRDPTLPRLAGWWGNDPGSRFRMQLQPEFVPMAGADGWQVSNPPILALAPIRAALDVFDEVGPEALRARSVTLTGYLDFLLRRVGGAAFDVLTPADPEQRGCQLSLRVRHGPRDLLRRLQQEGVVADFREPDVIRVAPVPLYNTFHEVWRFAEILAREARAHAV